MVSQTLTGTGYAHAAMSLDCEPSPLTVTLTNDEGSRTVSVDDGPPLELLRIAQHADRNPAYTWVIATTPTHDIEIRVSNQ
jgi:hypothetical protein